MKLDRRALMAFTASLAMFRGARADIAPVMPQEGDPEREIHLWPGKPPGGAHVKLVQTVAERDNSFGLRDRAVTAITKPTLSVFRPQRPNGASVLIAPGGSYQRVVVDKEGFETARLLAGRGITAFVLLYRLPGDGWQAGPDTPLQDAQRALRLVRSMAGEYKLDPARVGVLGFSAGGHLGASLVTRFDAKTYEAVDHADKLSARPDFAGLMYPVITMGDGAHMGSRESLIGKSSSAERVIAYSAERSVTAQTPPTFLCAAADDATVPIANTLMMFSALRSANVPSEMHIFEQGGHGFGLRGITGKPVAAWPDLFLSWARSHKMV
jgi:acetyl esterase/lipase